MMENLFFPLSASMTRDPIFFFSQQPVFGFAVFIFLFDTLLFMRRAKRNIPLTGRLLSPDINHRHGNETVLTKGETDGGIQMQPPRSTPPQRPSPPAPLPSTQHHVWATSVTSEWTIRSDDVQVRWDSSRGRRSVTISTFQVLDLSGATSTRKCII